MLHAPLHLATAKLDLSRLLESSPSLQSRQVVSENKQTHGTRSASDPPPALAFPLGSERGSISSTNSGSSTYAALSASSLPPQLSQQQGGAPTHQHHRPRIPSMSALPLPTSSFTSIEPRRHLSQALSTSSLPDPASFTYRNHPKRPAPSEPHPSASPAKRQSKWTPEEDALVIELRGAGMKWEDISKRIPGRTPLSCRLHYQNYIERRSQWDEDRKNRLARLYERLKPDMWKPLAAELNVPWRAAEAMHWQLGQADMARRAGVTPFEISGGTAGPSGTRLETSLVDTTSDAGYPPASSYTSTYGASPYLQQHIRQSYFEDRDAGNRGSSYSRPRSVSASSGEERQGSGGAHPITTSWAGLSVNLGSDRRYGLETWPLPRVAEDDSQVSPHKKEYSHSRHLSRSDVS